MISFIIPAHNEELLIGATIEAVHAACKGLDSDYEIVVANDASSDRTKEIALEKGARVADLDSRKISAARNTGAREAKGEYFIFVDADTEVSPGAVSGALREMQSGAVGGGAAILFEGSLPLWVRLVAPVTVFLFRLMRFTGGGYIFCTRDAFEAVGGFDERVYASEEVAMCKALKKQGRFVVLRESVVTSGRKLRAYKAREIFGEMARVALARGGKRSDLWYSRREDPETSK